MADPLRRTLLAKLRGKKAKKSRSGSSAGAGEGNAQVCRARDAQSLRADLDYVPGAMRGKQGCVHGGLEHRFEPCVRAHAGQGGDPSGFGVRDELKLSEQEVRIHPEAHQAAKQPVAFPRRHTEGDSIGFGNCSYGGSGRCLEPVFKTNLTNGRRNDLEMEQCISFGRADPGSSSDQPCFFQVLHPGGLNEHDLIRTIESSLQLSGDFSMPALQSPTFFPTELEIIDADLAPRLVCAREGTTRHNSVDSEDEDYYDNEILPFYEAKDVQGPTGTSSRPSQSGSGQAGDSSAQETDRLRSRLKEAYYLLIKAMDGIVFDGQMQPDSYAERSCSSSQSHDSLSVGSQSSARHSRSSGEHGGHLWTLRSPGVTSDKSRSLQNLLTAQARPSLRRSVSDGGVRYSDPKQDGDCTKAAPAYDPETGRKLSMDGAFSAEQAEEHSGVSVNNLDPVEGSGKPDSAQHEPRPIGSGVIAKPPGVTVNKMQEWMHKGRLLSSEMRQRIAGSSPHGSEGQARGFSAASRSKAGGHQASSGSANGGKAGILPQPVLIREPRDSCARLAPMNSITVSKKRNWLNQSAVRPSPSSDEDDLTPPPHIHPVPVPVPAPVLAPVSAPDPAEENDADDEGEIWYNPIPEDEEVELHLCETGPSGQRRMSEGEGGGASTGAGDSGNVSTEQSLLYRQTCRTQEDKLLIRPAAAESSEQSVSGFSPPSSPNPAKKSCSINWSLPERIKSPRTVRKLSMKMKKLPELSRKLSVKGNPTNLHSEPRTHLIKPADLGSTGVSTASASGNVIWRYHLDSSVGTQQQKKSDGLGAPKSAIKGGYLSDGDSPELVAKSGKHGSKSHRKTQEKDSALIPKLADLASFRPYSLPEQGKCASAPPLSGLLSVHLCGAEGLKTPRNDDSRHVYCAIQVDEAKRARTALLPCQADFLAMDHTFQLELEEAQRLRLVLYGCEATTEPRKQRVCCHGAVALATLFRTMNGLRAHKLAVRLEPRGVIYVKLGLAERRQSLTEANEGDKEREREVFGVEAARVVEREASGLMVPLIIEKCITEIERRGCQVVGLYRLCGSAAVKKELREAFERNSQAVELSESVYPDINVITGVLKDYLRELPHPLISKPLYEAVLDAMAKRPLVIGTGGCENDQADTEHATGLLETLPEVERVTLRRLLDHLKRVASHHEVNKMTCQNLAVCFGPVLLSQRQDASGLANRVFVDSEELASALHFKKHIEVLHYLLQLWPVVNVQGEPSSPAPEPPAPVRRRKERPQVLNLGDAELAGVLRPRGGRLDSPSNRYAGDWSDCRETYLRRQSGDEADYADVPSEGDEEKDREGGDGTNEREPEDVVGKADAVRIELQTEREEKEVADVTIGDVVETPMLMAYDYERRSKEHTYQAFMKIQEISPVLSNHVNLRDLQESIDALIGNLERELNKNKLNVGY